ncbi:hypothetical protein RvY_17547 [Ramazzottius varieornatus]|uniref:Uncharacterized protein n=1 Tax=Ramazzottius varieornatus TaxID=947166 RepID=A0A1D1W2H2_RAMVA|nr:hypothetical protein RvY_17547 [Ramazzottius varieornatus]
MKISTHAHRRNGLAGNPKQLQPVQINSQLPSYRLSEKGIKDDKEEAVEVPPFASTRLVTIRHITDDQAQAAAGKSD